MEIGKQYRNLVSEKKNMRKLEILVHYCRLIPLLTIFILCFFFFILDQDKQILGQYQSPTKSINESSVVDYPSLLDNNLKIETVARGFAFPTGIAFLGNNEILLLEKNTGNVYRITDGNVSNVVIHLNVSIEDERGLLGVAISKNDKSKQDNPLVFLYFTSCSQVKTDSSISPNCGNYLYRYKLDADKNVLVDPMLILELPFLPGPSHNGGVIDIDNENNVYVTIGDLQPSVFNKNQTGFDTLAQNILNGTAPDGRAGIIRLTYEGKPVDSGILGDEFPLNMYYAYGIRNSFGIDIDHISGNLWDTENGPRFGDEINLVEPGLNSGWEKVQGIWKLNQTKNKNVTYDQSDENIKLVDFDGKGKYSAPEFVWEKSIGPTALIFLASDKLGAEYKNDIFVGSVERGIIYHFSLTEDRKSLSLMGDLADLVYNKKDNASQIIFGHNFGIVTDLEVGPDGYLYVVSGNRGTDDGTIYRIVPNRK
jgi:glucose/arabinose dehydrogenase